MNKHIKNIPDEDIRDMETLSGHLGHKDVSDVIRKAIKAYIRLHSKEIAKIKKDKA